MKMQDCLFCKIASKEIPAKIVYEDKDTLAFLDVNPAAKGHTLVIHKKHYETIDELDEESAKNLILTVKKLAKVMLKISEGCNIIQNNKRVAGQIVNHVHFHVVPRNKGDGIHWNRPKAELNKEDVEEIVNKIKTLLK